MYTFFMKEPMHLSGHSYDTEILIASTRIKPKFYS